MCVPSVKGGRRGGSRDGVRVLARARRREGAGLPGLANQPGERVDQRGRSPHGWGAGHGLGSETLGLVCLRGRRRRLGDLGAALSLEREVVPVGGEDDASEHGAEEGVAGGDSGEEADEVVAPEEDAAEHPGDLPDPRADEADAEDDLAAAHGHGDALEEHGEVHQDHHGDHRDPDLVEELADGGVGREERRRLPREQQERRGEGQDERGARAERHGARELRVAHAAAAERHADVYPHGAAHGADEGEAYPHDAVAAVEDAHLRGPEVRRHGAHRRHAPEVRREPERRREVEVAELPHPRRRHVRQAPAAVRPALAVQPEPRPVDPPEHRQLGVLDARGHRGAGEEAKASPAGDAHPEDQDEPEGQVERHRQDAGDHAWLHDLHGGEELGNLADADARRQAEHQDQGEVGGVAGELLGLPQGREEQTSDAPAGCHRNQHHAQHGQGNLKPYSRQSFIPSTNGLAAKGGQHTAHNEDSSRLRPEIANRSSCQIPGARVAEQSRVRRLDYDPAHTRDEDCAGKIKEI
mmetsp:Transcript_42419/g.100672  ORF Transcript_42419/g.100672 Transcript_42419/m.100672 type:complete len:525 (+) Transcript_42419:279-1853(+)